MNYKETINKGLKRGYEVTIKSEEFNNGVNQKTEEIRKTIKVDGFRPGKVPASIVNQKHGDSIKAEVLNKLINPLYAHMVELVDTLVLGTSAARCGGSTPSMRTKNIFINA